MMKYAKLAWLGSLLLMLGAWFFEYGLNMRPCQLCIYQRIPHILVILLGGFLIWKKAYAFFPFLGAAVLLGAGIAFFHVGVEYGWWEGLKSCSSQPALDLDNLLATPPARCDEVQWRFFGLSMAAWNGLISIGLGTLWFAAWKRK